MSSTGPDEWPSQFTHHLNAGQLDAVLELYESEARFVTPMGEMLVGHDPIRGVLAGLIRAQAQLHSQVIKAVTVGEVALLYTDFDGTRVESGQTVDFSSRAIEVLRRQADGAWKLIVGDPNGRGKHDSAPPNASRGHAIDGDLDQMTRTQLIEEVQRLRHGIRQHRDCSGQELCWHHPALWGLLPERTDPLPEVPDWPEFLHGCVKYRQSLDVQAPRSPE